MFREPPRGRSFSGAKGFSKLPRALGLIAVQIDQLCEPGFDCSVTRAVATSQTRALLSTALRTPRKRRRQPLDLDLVKALYRRVAQGEYPTLRTIADVVEHFNTSARELHRLLGPQTKELSRTLAVSGSKAASQRRKTKKRILEAEVLRAVHRLLDQNKRNARINAGVAGLKTARSRRSAAQARAPSVYGSYLLPALAPSV